MEITTKLILNVGLHNWARKKIFRCRLPKAALNSIFYLFTLLNNIKFVIILIEDLKNWNELKLIELTNYVISHLKINYVEVLYALCFYKNFTVQTFTLSAAKLFTFRILTEKKYCQIKLQRLQKVETQAFGFLVLQINSL